MKKTMAFITAVCMSAVSLAAPVLSAGADAWDSSSVIEFCRNNEPGTYVEKPNGKGYQWLLDFDDMLFQKITYKNSYHWYEDKFLPEYFEVHPAVYDSETSRTYYSGGYGIIYQKYAKLSFDVSIESIEKINEYIKADEVLGEFFNEIICQSYAYDNDTRFKFVLQLYGNDVYEQVRKIKQEVQEIADAEHFYFTPVVEKCQRTFLYFLRYCPTVLGFENGYGIDGVTLEEIKETLEAYVAENNLDYTVEFYEGNMMSFAPYDGKFYGYELVPNDGGSIYDNIFETVQLSKQIYDDLGYNSWYAYNGNEDAGGAISYSSDIIDMSNNVDGDANCDGEYTIADATAILQSLGNPDKYGLSLQGEFNADIHNVGDGVTTMDALEIQKTLASKG